ncbi:GMP synthase [Bacillus pumilus]|uniref:GMP synthase n=1 Tax=Bacillus pumilus TaxID=1408 RepID=A0AB34QU06_BACPU|nr:GMP synthase [Bacillus pumilus]RAP11889.1 GMP synthase [Bacillus pumilus]
MDLLVRGRSVLGEISEEKLEIVRELDGYYAKELLASVLSATACKDPDIRSVGVMGDARKYDYTIGIREVSSIDGMRSDWVRISWDVIENNSYREWSEAY